MARKKTLEIKNISVASNFQDFQRVGSKFNVVEYWFLKQFPMLAMYVPFQDKKYKAVHYKTIRLDSIEKEVSEIFTDQMLNYINEQNFNNDIKIEIDTKWMLRNFELINSMQNEIKNMRTTIQNISEILINIAISYNKLKEEISTEKAKNYVISVLGLTNEKRPKNIPNLLLWSRFKYLIHYSKYSVNKAIELLCLEQHSNSLHSMAVRLRRARKELDLEPFDEDHNIKIPDFRNHSTK